MSDYSHPGNKMFPRWEENIPSLGISAKPPIQISKQKGKNHREIKKS
jgi:hypothetical protein